MDTLAPILALALFGLTFIAIVVRTMVFARATDFKRAAELPLQDETAGARHE
jgi:hypothetical protein